MDDDLSVDMGDDGGIDWDGHADNLRAERLGPMTAAALPGYAASSNALGALTQRLAGQRDHSLAVLNDAYKASAPDKSEKWLSIAAALLQPTQTGSTGESIGNALGVLGKYSGENRKAETERSIALARLAAQYDLKGADLAVRGLGVGKPKYQYDTQTGKFVMIPGTGGQPDLEPNLGGAPVAAPAAAIPTLTPQQVAANPNIRQWYTTDGRLMER